MSKKLRPLGIKDFPSISTNCFGFALGILTHVSESESKYNLNHAYPISEAFLRKVNELGYDLSQLRQISSQDEALPNEYIIKVYDFTAKKRKHTFFRDMSLTSWNFHLVRRELDGTWVHKAGWEETPCAISDEDWLDIEDEFSTEHVLFALAADDAE